MKLDSCKTIVQFLTPRLVASLLLVGWGPSALFAQDESDEEKIIQLSPFEVDASDDQGYMATQSMAGSRFAQDLRNIPAPVEVITLQMFDDLGVTDWNEVMDWSTNAVASGTDHVEGPAGPGLVDQERRSSNVRVRGGILLSQARNYFRWSVNSDRFNIGRVDNSRGPNAMLFGDSNLSGLSNITTKRALFEQSVSVSLQADSYGGGRVSFDYNQPLVDDVFSMRINAFVQDTDHWRDYGQNKRKAIALAGTIQATSNMTIRFEGEKGDSDEIFPKASVRGRISSWDHVTVMETPGSLTAAQATAAGLVREGGNTQTINGARVDDGIWNWATNGRSNGSGVYLSTSLPDGSAATPVLVNEPAILSSTPDSREMIVPDFSWGTLPMASRVKGDYKTASVYIENRFSDNFFMELAGNHQESDRLWHVTGGLNNIYYDVSKTLPDGYTINGSSENPDFLNPFVRGRPTVRNNYAESDEFRALAIYRLEGDWFRQSIGASVNYREFSGGQYRRAFTVTNGTNPNLAHVSNRPFVRYNLTDPSEEAALFLDGETYTIGDSTLEYVNTSAAAGGQAHSRTQLLSVMLNASGDWLESGRLHTTIGIRHDKFENDSLNNHVWDDVTNEYIRSDLSESLEDSVNSPSAGLVFDVQDWLSVFANYSKSFVFLDVRQLDYQDQGIDPPIGESAEVGIRFNFGRKFSGSIGYYDSEQINNPAVNNTINGQIRNEIYPTLGLPVFGNPWTTGTLSADGWEMQFVYNPSRSWSIRGNLSFPTASTIRPYDSFFQFWNENSPEWYAIANDPDDPNATTIADALAVIENQITQIEAGVDSENSIYEILGSVLARYSVIGGPLEGLTVGGGLKYRGQRLLAEVAGQNVYADGYFENTLFASYRLNAGESQYSIQLNVSNIFDEENFRFRTMNGAGVGQSYRISNPRNFRLTFTAEF